MELECDLGAIQSEELLRKMWQQSEDSERKRQIRSHLYKLRESRLRNLYRHEPDNLTFAMSEPNGNTLSGYAGKDPLATSHGDALLDQNFQSLKSKEVRDSMSPTHELKFHSMSLTQPNSTGWDVQTSSEVSPDGRAYRTETLAKTDGVEKLNGGGIAEFKGRNEQRSSASHQGDDKNYVKQAAESSNTHLQEKVVFGDESNGGRTEMKMSSTSSSSTSKFVSSSTVEYGDDDVAQPRYLLDNQSTNRQQHELREQREQREVREQRELREQREIREQRDREEQRVQEERFQEHRLQQQQEQREQREQREERFSESREQLKSTRNVETQQHYEENKRYVDMDKASPEYQRHVQHLMSQPGEIISNTVEYPKPNVKMITTVKRLPDGTIVKNKRYETEQVTPTADSVRQSQAQTQTQTQTQNNQRRVQETRDVVDNAEPLVRRPSETAEELVKQESYSTVKKSSRRYSTETTSETVQEYDDRAPQPSGRPDVPPSPRATNPIQEFPNHRPNTPNRPSDFSTHGFPSVRTNKPTQEFAGQRPTTEEYVVVKSEKSRNVKQSSSTTSQRTVETEFEPSWEQPQSPRRPTHVEDFSTHGFPSVRTDQPDAELPSSASRRPERIIETQVERERRPQQVNASPRRPQDSPTKSPTRKPNAATRTPPSRSTTETTTTTNTVTRRQLQKEREVDAAHRAFAASLRSSSPADSVGSTGSHHHPRRDSGQTPEPHPQRQAPRWSISSSSTNRRSGREGSHDSHAPSESSRISSTTVTRHVGVPKTIAKTTVSKQQQQQQQQTVVKTRSVQGSNETIDLTPQRLPKSPTAKSTTTTTTTTTTTIGNKPAGATPATPTKPATPTTPTTPTATSVPASEPSPVTDNQSQYTYATTKPADIFSLPPTNPTTPTINNNNNNNNETTTTTTLTTKNKKPSTSTSTSNDELLTKTKLSSNEATTTTTTTSAVHEPPCVRRNYYKLGPADATSEVPAQVADIAKAVTSTETVAAAMPSKRSPYAPRPSIPDDDHDDDDVPTVARRSSKSPSIERRPLQRESTFETDVERAYSPERITRIDDQIVIDESSLEVRQRPLKGGDKPREIPAAFPSRPKESPRQSPEKQLPSNVKQAPRALSPEKQPAARPRSVSPEKQLPRESQAQSSGTQLPGSVPSKPKESPSRPASRPSSPEKQMPGSAPAAKPKDLPRPDNQLPSTVVRDSRPDNQLPETLNRELPRQSPKETPRSGSPEKQLPSSPKPKGNEPADKPRQSPDRQVPGSAPLKPSGKPTPDDKQQPTQFPEDEFFKSTVTQRVTNITNNFNDEFITNERQHQPRKPEEIPDKKLPQDKDMIDRPSCKPASWESPERPDGGFISKSPEPEEDQKPTYRKKGLTRRETFEDRCRKILGMEEDGDTQGSFVPKPEGDDDDTDEQKTETVVKKTETFEFKIEDCPDDDDEDDKPKRVTQTYVIRTQPVIKVDEPLSEPETVQITETTEIETVVSTEKTVGERKPNPVGVDAPRPVGGRKPKDEVEPIEQPDQNKPQQRSPKDDAELVNVEEETTMITTNRTSKSPKSPLPKDEVEPRPTSGKWPKDEVETRPKSGKQPKDEKPQRPSCTRLSKDETELINVDEETTTIVTKQSSKSPTFARKAPLPSSEDEDEPISKAGKQPKDKTSPRSTPGKWPKDDAEYINVEEETTIVTTRQEPLPDTEDEDEPRPKVSGKPKDKHPKDDAEFVDVEEETTTVTTKRTSKTPTTTTRTPARKEPMPYPEDDDEPNQPKSREPTGRQPTDEFKPRPTPNYYSKDVEFIKVSDDTTIIMTKRPAKSPSPTRKEYSPYPDDEPTAKQPTAGKPFRDNDSPRRPKDDKEPRTQPKQPKNDAEYISEKTTVVITKRPSKSPSPTRKEPLPQTETKHFVTEKIIDCNGKTVLEKVSKTQRPTGPASGPKTRKQPCDSEPEEGKPKQPDSRKPSTSKIETERRNSRTTKTSTSTTSTTTNKQPVKETQPKTVKSPRKESLPRREPAKRDSLVEETRTTTSTASTTIRKDRKPSDGNNSLKDRLRSSPRKQKPQTDDVDGESSSPDTSPTRIPSERRRSSNISVHTEIIIDHTAPKTPSPKTERKVTPKTAASPLRKLPVTERKESAPVPRVTRRDKDKVTRSTSENVIKVVNGKPKPAQPEMSSLNPNSAQRPNTDRSRPSKCFTTRTINLSEQLINSEEMEDVIIDIQQAKSSREPSPDRIVPTPVPAEVETGTPRYPDTVQEPDDEPRKKPIVTNIPIFKEEANAYVGCQISELRNPNGIEADIHDNPTVEAPQSLDYTTVNPSNGQPGIDVDECLLSVHEKVTKFTHTAEQVKQPKSSTPFSRQFDEHAKVSASDECLLSIDEKVDRFLKTAENITKQPLTTPTREIERPSFEDIDEELRQDDCILSVSQKVHKFIDTAEKLAPSAPQKSPRLVANIERHISRQSEPELDQESEPEQPSDAEPDEPLESNDELLPMSKHHTTAIELKRQQDILNRPSVFNQRKPTTPNGNSKPRGTTSPSTTLITEERKSYRHQNVPASSPGARSPTRSTAAPRKPSLEQPRGKPSEPERGSTSTTKRREHITQQQWVISDVDVDVEEVGPAPPSHSVSPQPTAPGRRPTTSSTANITKSTPRSSTAPRKPSLESPQSKPSSDYPKETETGTRRATSTTSTRTTTKRGEQWLQDELDVDVEEYEPVSPKGTTPSRRTAPSTSTTNVTKSAPRSSTAPRKPSLESPRSKPSSDYPKETETSTRRATSTTSTKTTIKRAEQWVHSDLDVDVEEYEPVSPKGTSPSRRTTAATTKTTTRGASAPRKPSLESPRSKQSPTTDYTAETETDTRRTTSTTKRGEEWLPSDVDELNHSPRHSHSDSPRQMSPQRRTATTTKPDSTTNSKSTVVKASTEHSTTKHTTTTTNRTHSPTNQAPLASSPDTEPHVEPLLDRSRPTHQSSPGRTVASRRNIFEKHSPSPTTTTTTTSATTEPSGRRPSYMDHTKSSLEHIRRDSLEINKTHYSRKSSVDDETMLEPRNPNAAVKFDVPKRGSRPEAVRTTNTDELEIEEIFDLQTLEQLLETVSSYELRRRIRAQIRLIKKNMINANSSTTITTTTITTKGRQSEQLQPRSQSSTPSRSPMPVRRMPELPRERSQSPEAKGSTTTSTTTTCRRTEQLDSGKPPVKPRDRSASPVQTRRRSPTGKSSSTTTTTTTRTTKQAKVNPNEKPSPIWADRSKVLRASGSHSPTSRKGSNTSTTSSSSRVMRSSNITSSSTTTTSSSSSSKRREEDSITSSYGVGPTDENGLPLFGIRALKKKTQPPVEPCETKQEVTGYVIEEQFYSDDKSPPRHERKELIYSSNPDELVTLQQQLDTAQPDGQTTKLEREVKLIDVQGMPAAIEPPSGKRRGSIKELSERFIHKESMLADEETEDSESNDVCSVIELEAPQMRQHQTSSTTRTSSSTRSFLNTSGEERAVSSVDDVLERMRNADNVVEPGDSAEDREARALLNKFLGASVIMQGVESMLPAGQRQQQLSRGNISSNSNSSSSSQAVKTTQQQRSSSSSNNNNNNISSSSSNTRKTTTTSSAPVTRTTCDIEAIWDEQLLRQLLEQASTYEERRKIRARLRELMAEREAQHKQQSSTTSERTETKSKDGGAIVTTTTTKVTTRTVSGSAANNKNISPLAKFKQLDKAAQQQQAQKSSPTTSTPTTPGGSAQPYFKFTDPALNARAATVKDQLLQWCQHKTQEYENVQISNFSSSWSDGLAFCALIHHFLPDAFDYSQLTKQTRKHNFELAFSVADEKAGIAPLLDVEDMVEMSRPDWKCVFVYVQSIYRRFRNCQ
ncbi:mucin-5AC isoform X3 [Drosophila mojavensis]|nr:mucin-5AC isoform X3 [Drosophila mojavensis]